MELARQLLRGAGIKNMLFDSGSAVTVVFHQRVLQDGPVQFQRSSVTVERSVARKDGKVPFAYGTYLWPSIIEKAWTVFKLGGQYTKIPENRSASIVFEALLGRVAEDSSMVDAIEPEEEVDGRDALLDEQTLAKFLRGKLTGHARKLVTAGTKSIVDGAPKGIIGDHWYEVVSIAETGTIRVRNPHGKTKHAEAEIDLTPKQMIACFSNLTLA